MNYLGLGYFDKKRMDALPKEKVEAIMQKCQVHLEEFYKSGQVVADVGVSQEAKNLRQVDGKLQVGESQLTQLEKMIGSAFIIEAQNIEEAIEIASLHPTVQVTEGEQLAWEIEIRAIDSFYKKN